MRDDYTAIRALNARVIGIARHTEKEVVDFWEKHDLPFTGIADKEGKIGKLFGQEWKLLKLGLMPALFVVSQDGRLSYSYYSDGMSDIPKNDEILQHLKHLQEIKGTG